MRVLTWGMLNFFRKYLQTNDDSATKQPSVELATTMLLLETADVDGSIADVELEHLQAALRQTFSLSNERVQSVLAQARKQLNESVGMYEFSRCLREAWGIQQRRQLMVSLWTIALADGRIDHYEESHLRQAADQLGLIHQEYIQAKHQASAQFDAPE